MDEQHSYSETWVEWDSAKWGFYVVGRHSRKLWPVFCFLGVLENRNLRKPSTTNNVFPRWLPARAHRFLLSYHSDLHLLATLAPLDRLDQHLQPTGILSHKTLSSLRSKLTDTSNRFIGHPQKSHHSTRRLSSISFHRLGHILWYRPLRLPRIMQEEIWKCLYIHPLE